MSVPHPPPAPTAVEARHARRTVAATENALLFLAWWIVGALIPVALLVGFVAALTMMP